MLNLNSKTVRDHICDYLDREFILKSFTGLGGEPDLEHIVLDLNLVNATEEALEVECAFDFDERLPMTCNGITHHRHRRGHVQLRLDPETGEVQSARLL